MPNALQEMAERYLTKLYELSEGGLHPEVDQRQMQSELEISLEEAGRAIEYLQSKDLVSGQCRVPCIRITTRGIDVMQNSHEVKEIRVLQKI